jgi:hypothetical protein
MKIVITEEQKNKLFIPRKIDERQGQLKKELIRITKKILSHFNITEMMLHGSIDDYDDEITAEDHLEGSYNKLIIDRVNYYGFPKQSDLDDKIIELINNWEDTLATYLNTVIPQPSDESIATSSPNIINRVFRVDITPSKIDVSFSYSIVEYTKKKGNEAITL